MLKSLLLSLTMLSSLSYAAVKVQMDFNSGDHKLQGEKSSFYDEPIEFKDDKVKINVMASKFMKTNFETELAQDEVFLEVDIKALQAKGLTTSTPSLIAKLGQKAIIEVEGPNESYKIALTAKEVEDKSIKN
jgi:hypothetical protein